MLILLNQAWPWIIIGILLIYWGLSSLRITPIHWVRVFISIFFSNFGAQTKTEKRAASAESIEEAVSDNVGCVLILLGLICLGYGVIRWIS